MEQKVSFGKRVGYFATFGYKRNRKEMDPSFLPFYVLALRPSYRTLDNFFGSGHPLYSLLE